MGSCTRKTINWGIESAKESRVNRLEAKRGIGIGIDIDISIPRKEREVGDD